MLDKPDLIRRIAEFVAGCDAAIRTSRCAIAPISAKQDRMWRDRAMPMRRDNLLRRVGKTGVLGPSVKARRQAILLA